MNAQVDAQDDRQVQPLQLEASEVRVHFSQGANNQATALDLVEVCQAATGVTFMFTQETQELLASKPLMGMGQERIPKERFYAFFQTQMFIHQFICVELGDAQDGWVLIRSQQASGRLSTSIRQTATLVDSKSVQAYANKSATLISTSLQLPNLETRTLAQSLRGLMTDTSTQALMPLGDHSILITGLGPFVASLTRLLENVNNASSVPAATQTTRALIPLKHASAFRVASLISNMLNLEMGPTGRVQGAPAEKNDSPRVQAVMRTNSLLVQAPQASLTKIRELIMALDQPAAESQPTPQPAGTACDCKK